MSLLYRMFGKVQDTVTRVVYGVEQQTSKMSFYSCVDKMINGDNITMSEYTGDVVLLVNVASKWGLTKQNYQELPQLSDEYSCRGLKILAFPCNQFGAQEPGTNEEILEFVKRYDADMVEKLTFFEKADVNGANARETYTYVKPLATNSDGSIDIRWNFAKFLVDHQGNVYKRYDPKTPPLDMKDDIEMLLKKRNDP